MPAGDPSPFQFPFTPMQTYPDANASPPSVPFRSCCVCGGSPCRCPQIHLAKDWHFNPNSLCNIYSTVEYDDNQLKWDKRFLALAKEVSTWSKDPSTKVGAVITKGKRIVSVGYNGFPEGIEDTPERLNDRDTKYAITQHGEENAILFTSESLEGCTMYTWPFASCSRCAGKLIQKRFKRLVYPKLTDPGLIERWGKSLELTFELLDEVGIERVEIECL